MFRYLRNFNIFGRESHLERMFKGKMVNLQNLTERKFKRCMV